MVSADKYSATYAIGSSTHVMKRGDKSGATVATGGQGGSGYGGPGGFGGYGGHGPGGFGGYGGHPTGGPTPSSTPTA